jgi:FixJ family two-component response regulator
MTQQRTIRVFLVGASQETAEELTELAQAAPYELIHTDSIAELLNEPADLAGACILVSDETAADAEVDGLRLLQELLPLAAPPASIFLVSKGNVQRAVDARVWCRLSRMPWPARDQHGISSQTTKPASARVQRLID